MIPGSRESHVSWQSLFKILTFVVATYLTYLLFPFLLLVFLSALLAVTLDPVVKFMVRHRIKKQFAILMISVSLVLLVGVIIFFVFPPLIHELANLISNAPHYRTQLLEHFKDGYPRKILDSTLNTSVLDDLSGYLAQLLVIGRVTAQAIFEFLFVLVLAIYLLLDGDSAYRWVLHFFSPTNQLKLAETATEISKVIFAYVSGVVIMSLLATTFAFIVLTSLSVPGSFALGVIAGVFDILPVLGILIFSVPAILLALTVSGSNALIVALLYLGYHGLENYVVAPRVYGQRMRLSSLVVLLSLTIGGLLAGIPGAIAALPIAASYPIVERIWLRKYFSRPPSAEQSP